MNTYFKTGVITLLIFLSGLMFGLWLDNFRLSEIRQSLSQVDIDSNDVRLLSRYFQLFGQETCEQALQQNLEFNTRIYQDGLEIERAIEASGLTPEIEQEQRRYVLLQSNFWFNSLELKKDCGFNYTNVIHLFKTKDLTNAEKVENRLQSGVMLDLKEKCGHQIMLIPLAADLDLQITDAILKQYNLQKLPAVIINESMVFQGLTSMNKLNNMTNC